MRSDRAVAGAAGERDELLFLGNFSAARSVFEQCGGLRDPVHRSIYTTLMPIDPYLVMLGYYGLTLGYLGISMVDANA
jgi:hypothetical protein